VKRCGSRAALAAEHHALHMRRDAFRAQHFDFAKDNRMALHLMGMSGHGE